MNRDEDMENVIAREVQHALALQQTIKASLQKVSPSRTRRNILSATLYHLCFEHTVSVIKLVEIGHAGSAMALIRPACESFLRGMWVQYCAPDQTIEELIRGERDFPGYKDLNSGIEAKAPHEMVSFKTAIDKAIPIETRHSLTHGGAEQFRNRFDGNVIRSTFSEKTVVGFIRAATVIMVAVANGMARQGDGHIDPNLIFAHLANHMYDIDPEVKRIVKDIASSSGRALSRD